VTNRASLIGLFALLCTGTAFAGDGGMSWSFEVLEVVESVPEGHIIRLRPSPPGKNFPRSCETFVIYSIFDVRDWSQAARNRASRKSHDRAVKAIEQANAAGRLIRIGTLGNGFAAIAEKPRCEVASQVLQLVVRDGQAAVISFYDEP
jgi:hypothetical protein